MRKMKGSGIEWIGEIPENWNIGKISYFYDVTLGKMVDNNAVENQSNYLCAANIKWTGVNTDVEKKMYFSDAEKEQYLLSDGDVLIMEGGMAGTSCIYRNEFSPCYIQNSVHRCRPRNNDCNKFLYYWMFVVYYSDYISNICNKATIMHYTKEKVKATPFLVVPINEQQSISTHLDRQCAHIDNIIEKTKASIEEYKKLRQAVITQAVTKGVRGDRAMKDSGIEWIGEIPEEWEKTKLGRISSLRSGITLGRKIPDDAKMIERPYLRVANVQNGYVDTSTVTTLEVTEEEDEKYRLHKDDVLMTEGGDRDKLGRGCVWDGAIEPCLHQNHIFALRTNPKYLNQYYFAYITASQIGRVYFDITAIKTTNLACTSSSKVLAFIIPLPTIEEQQEIAAYLDQKCAEIDTLITKKEQFLTELESYKKSMIYEYVTGKKEVPSA